MNEHVAGVSQREEGNELGDASVRYESLTLRGDAHQEAAMVNTCPSRPKHDALRA